MIRDTLGLESIHDYMHAVLCENGSQLLHSRPATTGSHLWPTKQVHSPTRAICVQFNDVQ